MVLTPEAIKARLKQLGIRTDKYLGQHFLIDESVLNATVVQTQQLIEPNDLIVEVGPGLGVLTQGLVKLGKPVITIEKDPILAKALPQYINQSNLTVIEGDILRLLDLNRYFPFTANQEKSNWLFVANIPYGITSPLLRKLVELEFPPRHILVLMQKEVAERLAAQPGNAERGLLTVEIELAGTTHIKQTVPADSFWPAPKVESTLVHIDLTQPNLRLTPQEKKDFLKVVKAGFSAKRKQLQNSLAGGLNLPMGNIKQALLAAGIDPKRRAETLTLEEWSKLTKSLKNSV